MFDFIYQRIANDTKIDKDFCKLFGGVDNVENNNQKHNKQ